MFLDYFCPSSVLHAGNQIVSYLHVDVMLHAEAQVEPMQDGDAAGKAAAETAGAR